MIKELYRVSIQGKEKSYTLSVWAFSLADSVDKARKLLDKNNKKNDIILLSKNGY